MPTTTRPVTIRPLQDRIVTIPEETTEQITQAGVILPETAFQKAYRAKVIAVGPGRISDEGAPIPVLGINEGDTILYSRYGGMEIKENDRDYLILRETDVLAVLDDGTDEE